MAATLTNLTIAVALRVTANAVKAIDLSAPKDSLAYDYSASFTFGNGAAQCDALFHDSRSLASSTSEDFDLAGGGTDAFGDTVTFANVKLLLIENTSPDADAILDIGGAAANQFSTLMGAVDDEIKIHPGESKLLICRTDADGFVVTGGTADLLKIDNQSGSNTATYKIIIAGDSA